MMIKLKRILQWLMPAFYLLASVFLIFNGVASMSKKQNIFLGVALLFYSIFRFYRAIKTIQTDEKELDD